MKAVLIMIFLVWGCARTDSPSDSRPQGERVEAPVAASLSEVSQISRGYNPPPVARAYEKYRGKVILVRGVVQLDGVPPGLGTHATVGLHTPPKPDEARIGLSGNVPEAYGKKCAVVGEIVKEGEVYRLKVHTWKALED